MTDFASMNLNTKIIDYGENPQTFEDSFTSLFTDEFIPQKAGTEEFSVLKNVSATEYEVHGVMKQKHDSLLCATCNSYITKRASSHKRTISRKPEVAADFLVERVVNELDIHDLCCISCNSYRNKSLPRRDISPDEATVRTEPGQVTVPMPGVIDRDTLTPEGSQLDIVKAVVYGGLQQSITSLSVVVSAAGGDVSTLNIVALGLANVFGGLLVLAHNLRALKQEQNTQHYAQELGRQGHFLLHATLAVISYLMFGVSPCLIYGFTFYKSDNKYLKLATLAAVSLVCITLLSIGKAYVQRPPKAYMKTILSYISLGVMVAGPGYIAGDLANMLLKKLEMFNSLSSDSINLVEAEMVKRAWSSY